MKNIDKYYIIPSGLPGMGKTTLYDYFLLNSDKLCEQFNQKDKNI